MKTFIKTSIKCIFLSLITTLTISCSLFGPVKRPPMNTYILKAADAKESVTAKTNLTLLVNLPETAQAFNTRQMAYSLRPFQIGFYAQNEWAATPSQMLQPLLVQKIQNSQFFRAVVEPPFMGNYDYILSTAIIDFYIDYNLRPAIAKLTLHAQLTKGKTNKVLAATQFTIQEPFPGISPYRGAIAMNIATERALDKVNRFVIPKARNLSKASKASG